MSQTLPAQYHEQSVSPVVASAGIILGPDGQPFRMEDIGGGGNGRHTKVAAPGFDDNRLMLTNYGSYVAGVYNLEASAVTRALEPFATHAWVFAGAMAIARNLSQAPFTMYQETETQLTQRGAVAKANGRAFYGGRSGRARSAIHRHLMQRGRDNGRVMKGLQEDLDSPYQEVFNKPNFLMTADQFWVAHWLWMMLRGECFWVLTSGTNEPYRSGDVPDQIFPMSPDLFRPVYRDNVVAAWRMRTPRGLGGIMGKIETFMPEEVILYKYFNPVDMVRGMAPITASAGPIKLDLMLLDSETALIHNGSEPTGVVMTEKGFEFPDEQAKNRFRKGWEQRHQGEKGKGRLAILEGMSYLPTGLSPHEMQGLDTRKWDREEVLATLGVPPTSVGITDKVNKATAKVIDRALWQKTLIPIARNTEATLDGTLFFQEPDNIVGAFDLTKVDALREEVTDQVTAAVMLAGAELHVPPKAALDMVGLSTQNYPYDEVSLVQQGMVTVDAVVSGATLPPTANGSTGTIVPPEPADPPIDADPSQGEDPNNNPTDKPTRDPQPSSGGPTGTDNYEDKLPEENALRYMLSGLRQARRKAKKDSAWKTITRKVQQPAERQFASSWSTFIRREKVIALHKFDESTVGKRNFPMWNLKVKSDFSIDDVLQDITGTQNRLKKETVQAYDAEHESVYEFTIEELGGVAVFGIDDPKLLAVIKARQDLLLGSAPATIQQNVRQSLSAGMEDGETIGQLRDRVASVYDLSSSDSKTLMIARTESAGTMNSMRDVIFDAQGIDTIEWTTAEDEHVRPTHVIYGNAGSQKRGFNFLSLAENAGEGSLTFPGDPDAPAGEVINCRCCAVPGGIEDGE